MLYFDAFNLNVSPAQGELGTWQNGKGVISLNSAEKIVGWAPGKMRNLWPLDLVMEVEFEGALGLKRLDGVYSGKGSL